MSQNWKRGLGLFRPNLEEVEARTVPAGNITAYVDGGVLVVRTDDQPQAFNIASSGHQSVIIRPLIGTTVNGSFEPQWFDDIEDGFDIKTGASGDTVIIDALTTRGFLSIDTGGGGDAVHLIQGVEVHGSTWIRTGDGDDFIYVDGSSQANHFAIDAGAGDDRVNLINNSFSRDATVAGGTGNNTLGQVNSDASPTVFDFQNQAAFLFAQSANDILDLRGAASGTVNVLANDTAVQGSLDPASVRITRAPSSGTAAVNADGTITYTGGATVANDFFRYTVTNSVGGVSNEATVAVIRTGSTTPPPPPTADTTAPTATLATNASDPTRTTPIPFTLTFNEDVTGFAKSDLTVTGGTASEITSVSASQYTFTVTPASDGTVSVTVPAGAAQDAAGNANTASNVITRSFDGTPPTVTANTLTTNDTTPTLTGTVSDSAATVTVTVNGQTAQGTVTGTSWTATLGTVLPEGKYTIAAAATDRAGNVGNASVTDGLVIDTTAPTANVTSSLSSPTNTNPIPVTVIFSENVSNFVATDVTVTNGTVNSFASTDAKTYTFNVAPAGDGNITVSVPAGVAQDTAGTGNTTSNTFSITFNSNLPTVTLTSATTNPTNDNPFTVQATFSKEVTGFVISDIAVTNGSVSNFIATDKKTYTFDVTPTSNGTVTVNVPANVALDGSNNGNVAATPLTRVFDNIAPTAVVSTTASNPTTTSPIPFRVVFDEEVTDFTLSDVVVTNGTASGLLATANKTFTFNVTPTVSGNVSVSVPINAAHDAADNGNPASNTITIVFTNGEPVLTLTSTAPDPTNAKFQVFATFNENVTDFESSDIVVGNGTVSGFVATDPKNYSFFVTGNADGLVTVDVPANAAIDDTAKGNLAATQLTRTFDTTAPTIVINALTTDDSTPTITGTVNESNTTVEVTVNGTKQAAVVTGMSWSATFTTVIADGTYDIAVSAKDAATNVGTNTLTDGLIIDTAAPSAAITSTLSGTTNAAIIPMTVTFSEDVDDFDSGDVVLGNATLSNFVMQNDKTYTFELSAIVDGAVTVNVPAGAAMDAVGNPSTAATQFTIVSDRTGPTTTLDYNGPNPTKASSIPVSVSFNEDVTGFVIGDITTNNGTISNLVALNKRAFTFQVEPATAGSISLNVAAGVATDAVGNGNQAAFALSIEYDPLPPTGTIDTGSATAITGTADGTISSVKTLQISIFNGTNYWNGTAFNSLTEFFLDVDTADDFQTWSYDFNTIGSFTVHAHIVDDVDLFADVTQTVTVASAPSAAITSTLSGTTNAVIIPMTVTFSEDVDDFDAGDVVLGNATLSNFVMQNDKTYTFELSAIADGAVTVDVPAGVAMDALGNPNTAAIQFTIVSDRTRPTTTLNYTGPNPTRQASIPVSVSFNEDVIDFDIGDITTNNGSISHFVVVNDRSFTFQVDPATAGSISLNVAAGVATDAVGNGNQAAIALSIEYDPLPPTGTIDTVAVTAITGTADGTISSVKTLQISIFNGTSYWDGTDFNSLTEFFLDVDTTDDFQTWSYDFIAPGSFTVHAHIVDDVDLFADVTETVTVA